MELREKPYHFIGIGGDGMSALAWLLHQQGHSVTGSDCRESVKTALLRSAGIDVQLGHNPAHIESSSAVVYSSAIGDENVELQEAKARQIDVLHRQELLAEIFNAHSSVGIAGTHGKTTTSAMIATLMSEGGIDPTYLIGAPTPSLAGSASVGQSRWLVSEVCESDGHFVKLLPEIAVITNVGTDHLDHYHTQERLIESFGLFVGQSRTAVLCVDDPQYEALNERALRSLSFSLNEESGADLVAKDIRQSGIRTTAKLTFRGRDMGELSIAAPGKHNILNALAAILSGYCMGLTFSKMLETLSQFVLPQRRFQILEENGFVIVDDYAHLPEQIELNLEAARAGWPERRQIAIFQPHRYSRMSYMTERFASALSGADLVLVTDIYSAFERPIEGVCAENLVRLINRAGTPVQYVQSLDETYEYLSEVKRPGDFIIGFGAGDIWQVLHRLVREK